MSLNMTVSEYGSKKDRIQLPWHRQWLRDARLRRVTPAFRSWNDFLYSVHTKVAVNTQMQFACQVLTQDHLLSVRNDITHHLLKERNIERLKCATLSKVVLGMLNTGLGGSVFLGVSEMGLVVGVPMTQQQQDECMLGVSRLLRCDITPSLLPCDWLVRFLPVRIPQAAIGVQAYSEDADDGTALLPTKEQQNKRNNDYDKCYVIVITVRPQQGVLYRSADSQQTENYSKVLVRESCSNVLLAGPRLSARVQQNAAVLRSKEQQVLLEKEALRRAAQEC